MTRIAINGFGRIGKLALRSILERNLSVEVVAVNDLSGTETAAHLFQFDSAYGRFPGTVQHNNENLIINGKKIKVCADREPENLPWKELGVDIVLECTGVFRTREGATKHLKAGAKRVIISAPGKDEIDGTFVMGVNEKSFKDSDVIISNASCTTNCIAPVVKVLNDNFGIERGLMNTVHSYTSSQPVIDAAQKDLRRSRAAGESIIPTTTGAAKAVSLVIPELEGKLDGFAIRIPTLTVSIVDLTFETKKDISVEIINKAFKKASEGELKGILGYEERPLVSIDYRKDSRSSIIDAELTKTMGAKFAKVVAWYDNEWGYACRLVDLAEYISR